MASPKGAVTENFGNCEDEVEEEAKASQYQTDTANDAVNKRCHSRGNMKALSHGCSFTLPESCLDEQLLLAVDEQMRTDFLSRSSDAGA